MIEKQSKKIKEISNQSKGGHRPGAGRKAGVRNKKTAEILIAVEASGITPLEFMLNIMRKGELPVDTDPAIQIAHNNMRFEAAKAAAPYVHAKLASIEVNASITTHEAGLDDLA